MAKACDINFETIYDIDTFPPKIMEKCFGKAIKKISKEHIKNITKDIYNSTTPPSYGGINPIDINGLVNFLKKFNIGIKVEDISPRYFTNRFIIIGLQFNEIKWEHGYKINTNYDILFDVCNEDKRFVKNLLKNFVKPCLFNQKIEMILS